MAVRLVNRSKADCDINLHDGRTVRIKPSSYIKIGDTISDSAKAYYRQLNDLGLFAVEEPVVQSEEPVVQSEEPVVQSEEPVVQSEEPVVQSEEPVVQSEEPVVQSEEPVVRDKESEAEEVDEKETLTIEELMKHRHSELVEIATSYGIDELEGLSKKQISEKIIEVVNG